MSGSEGEESGEGEEEGSVGHLCEELRGDGEDALGLLMKGGRSVKISRVRFGCVEVVREAVELLERWELKRRAQSDA